ALRDENACAQVVRERLAGLFLLELVDRGQRCVELARVRSDRDQREVRTSAGVGSGSLLQFAEPDIGVTQRHVRQGKRGAVPGALRIELRRSFVIARSL